MSYLWGNNHRGHQGACLYREGQEPEGAWR